MDRERRNSLVFVALILLMFVVALMVQLGCASAPPCNCPEFELPEVVEIPVPGPVLLPVPRPPAYVETESFENVYENFLEAFLAEKECRKIIEKNNEQASRNP